MIRTWGYLFEANEKKNIKIHVNPAKFTSLLCGLCYTNIKWSQDSKAIFLFKYTVESDHSINIKWSPDSKAIFLLRCNFEYS